MRRSVLLLQVLAGHSVPLLLLRMIWSSPFSGGLEVYREGGRNSLEVMWLASGWGRGSFDWEYLHLSCVLHAPHFQQGAQPSGGWRAPWGQSSLPDWQEATWSVRTEALVLMSSFAFKEAWCGVHWSSCESKISLSEHANNMTLRGPHLTPGDEVLYPSAH